MVRSLLRMLKHISFAVIAIIATVCVAEVGLRGYELHQRCRGGAGGGCPLAPKPCPIAFQHLTPLVHVTRPSVETGEPVTVRTNSLGLRGPEIAIPKPTDVYRIVCLGDDATFAPEIAEEAVFPALVEAALNQQSAKPIEVVNAGLPGYCPLLTLAWARHQLTGLQPDLVVLCCHPSDVADNRRVRPLAKYNDNGQLETVGHPSASQRPQSLLQAAEEEFELAAVISRQLRSSLDDQEFGGGLPEGWETPAESAPATAAIHIRQAWEPIAPLRDLCDQLNADFVVALIPATAARNSRTDDNSEVVSLLGEAAEEFGVPYLDVTAEFASPAASPLFLANRDRLSTAGHHLFAELLSWAIIHRGGDAAIDDASSSPITPAVAEETSTVPPSTTTPAVPTPLPPVRQPRRDESLEWSR